MKRKLPNIGSLNDKLNKMSLGERLYLDSPKGIEGIRSLSRQVHTPPERRPLVMKSMRFSGELFITISSRNPEDIRYLLCVTRTA